MQSTACHLRASELLAPDAGNSFRRPVIDTPRVRSYMLRFPPREPVARHAHTDSDELFFIVAGSGLFRVGNREQFVAGAGDAVLALEGEYHTIVAGPDGLTLLAVVAPNVDDCVFDPPLES